MAQQNFMSDSDINPIPSFSFQHAMDCCCRGDCVHVEEILLPISDQYQSRVLDRAILGPNLDLDSDLDFLIDIVSSSHVFFPLFLLHAFHLSLHTFLTLWPLNDLTPSRYQHTSPLLLRSWLLICPVSHFCFVSLQRPSGRKTLPTQDSDGQSSCPTVVVGVIAESQDPSSLSVKENMFQRRTEEEELDAKITRRVQRAARRQAKQEQLKRLHKAQVRPAEVDNVRLYTSRWR